MKYAWRRSVPVAERGNSSAAEAGSRSNGAATAPSERGRSRKRLRRLANVLIGIAVAALLYGSVVLLRGDPVTGLYARWKQHQLSGELDQAFQDYATTLQPSSPGDLDPQELAAHEHQRVATQTREFITTVKLGDPLGRLIIPKMGVNAVLVHGTRWAADLTRGPGHYPETELPGLGKTVAIAGHRTTFGAWFRDIDSLKAGDSIVVRLPYATFHYRVFGHRIVPKDAWGIIRDRGFDALVLSACHPLYGSAQRWIVYAAAYRVDPLKGTPYLVDMQNEPRPSSL